MTLNPVSTPNGKSKEAVQKKERRPLPPFFENSYVECINYGLGTILLKPYGKVPVKVTALFLRGTKLLNVPVTA